MHLQALGGSGEYEWATSDENIISVSDEGIFKSENNGFAVLLL